MKIFGLEIRRSGEGRKAPRRELSALNTWGAPPVRLASRRYPMLLSAVYRCVDLISDSLACLPCEVFDVDAEGFRTRDRSSGLARLLSLEPDGNMSAYTFFKLMVSSMLLQGNAYAYIERDGEGRPLQLVYVPAGTVMVQWVKDARGYTRKRYLVSGLSRLVEPFDMIHILNFSYDGNIGVSTLEHARQTLNIATESEEHASGFFASGGQLSGVINVTGNRLSKEQKDAIYETWAGRMHSGGVAVLEANMTYQPVSINPKDSQLLESRQFNVVDICRFFGVSPVKCFDLSKSSYSTVEATQIEYLTDTLQPVMTRFEEELNRKLVWPEEWGRREIRFDTAEMLRTNKATQGEYLRSMMQAGAYTPNEIRREIGLAKVEGGDEALVQVNMARLRDMGRGVVTE